jgi:hypothetical protein
MIVVIQGKLTAGRRDQASVALERTRATSSGLNTGRAARLD